MAEDAAEASQVKRLHIVPGLEVQWNGIAVAAKMIARVQLAAIVDAGCNYKCEMAVADEVWVHSLWTFRVWMACWDVVRKRKRLIRMLHGNVDPLRLKYHGWKKWLVGPIERFLLRRADRIVATCAAEADWIRSYEPRVKKIEVTDIKRFFRLEGGDAKTEDKGKRATDGLQGKGRPLHLLYLGRKHPLKGLAYLKAAVAEIVSGCQASDAECPVPPVEFRIVSDAFGEEKELVWEWCDVLVLPTLSENFGLVVAEALERGKRVITTDGAPAWGDGNDYGGRMRYLVGYRDGTRDVRVQLLKDAIERAISD